MDNTDYKVYIETKKINDIFYIYKSTRVSAEETITFYGFCTFMGDKMITAKQGFEFFLITQETFDSFEDDLQKYCCDLEDIFNNPEKYADSEKYVFVRKEGELVWPFEYDLEEPEEILFVSLTDKIIGITSANYDIPTSIMLMQKRKDIAFLKPLWGFEDVHEDGLEKLEISWIPNKKQWALFIYKLFSSSYQETLEFIADNIFKLPKVETKKPQIETVSRSVNGLLKFETVKINKDFYSCKVEKEFDGFSHEDYFICTAEELELLKTNQVVPDRILNYEIMRSSFKEMYRIHPISSGFFDDIIYDIFIPPEMVFEVDFNEEDLMIVVTGHREPAFEYYEGLSKIPMARPLFFKRRDGLTYVSENNYDLEKVATEFEKREDIIFERETGWVVEKDGKTEGLIFGWIPTENQWKEICDKYFKDLEETKKYGAIMVNLIDNTDIGKKVLEEYVLPKKEVEDNA